MPHWIPFAGCRAPQPAGIPDERRMRPLPCHHPRVEPGRELSAMRDDSMTPGMKPGGAPFPTVQFAVSKRKIYDLRVDWRQSYYYWNQNDNVVLPIASATTGI